MIQKAGKGNVVAIIDKDNYKKKWNLSFKMFKISKT